MSKGPRSGPDAPNLLFQRVQKPKKSAPAPALNSTSSHGGADANRKKAKTTKARRAESVTATDQIGSKNAARRRPTTAALVPIRAAWADFMWRSCSQSERVDGWQPEKPFVIQKCRHRSTSVGNAIPLILRTLHFSASTSAPLRFICPAVPESRNPLHFPLNRCAVAEEFVVFVEASLAGAENAEGSHKFDGLNPLDLFEA